MKIRNTKEIEIRLMDLLTLVFEQLRKEHKLDVVAACVREEAAYDATTEYESGSYYAEPKQIDIPLDSSDKTTFIITMSKSSKPSVKRLAEAAAAGLRNITLQL